MTATIITLPPRPLIREREQVIPRYTCECGFKLACTHWPENSERCNELFDQHMPHMNNNNHLMIPDDAPVGMELECEDSECEHNGCNASDCVAKAQTYGECGYCGKARVVVLPPEGRAA